MADVAIIGAGSWGIALAKVLHTNGNKVTVWSIVEDEITMLKEKHEHVQKLPGVKLPEDMEFTTDLESAVSGKAYLILAVPSVFTRSTAKSMAPFVKEGQIIVCVAKGIEEETLMPLTDIVEQEIPQAEVAVMCGPSHAEEVGIGLPTTVVAGAKKRAVAEEIQDIFMNNVFRVYTSPDVLGMELGGSLKNVIALAAGMADGNGIPILKKWKNMDYQIIFPLNRNTLTTIRNHYQNNQERNNMSNMLEKARKYETEKIAATDPQTKPLFHVSAPTGWINDPNGFSFYDGQIHLFYQYHPYNREWGPMHWGHSVTCDMIQWEQLPAALAPDEEYDKAGCFSGSAIEADGKHVLVYTGVTRIKQPDGSEQDRQNQCIAFGDGKDYQKYDKNPVMTGEMLPEGCNRVDFRDPKIWKENDTYYMIVGNKNENQIGQVVLCSSKNLTDWKFETILASNESGKIGTMWECPDFFQLGSKRVLICSPQDMKAQKYEFHNGHNSVYFLGDYDEKTHTFVKELPHALDYGMDFYAPQTTELPDGRRIMIAWMKSWDACVIPNSQDWQGMMTLPRELELKDGKIWQTPVREIEKYHKNPCRYDHAEINQETTLCGIEGRTIDLTVLLEEDEFQTFSMKLAANKEYETSFTYHKAENMLEIDRTYCGVTKDVVCVRKLKISNPEGLKKMRFILDRQSIELFLNNGEQVATTAICTPLEAQEIHFYSDKKIHINVEKYGIVKL